MWTCGIWIIANSMSKFSEWNTICNQTLWRRYYYAG